MASSNRRHKRDIQNSVLKLFPGMTRNQADSLIEKDSGYLMYLRLNRMIDKEGISYEPKFVQVDKPKQYDQRGVEIGEEYQVILGDGLISTVSLAGKESIEKLLSEVKLGRGLRALGEVKDVEEPEVQEVENQIKDL